jgi:hypothetical protein
VKVISDLGGPGSIPTHQPGTRLIASVDVEWTKNYRIKDGNQAFCYSIVWIAVPAGDRPADLDSQPMFWSTSVYLDRDTERADLVDLAASDLAAATEHADLVTGHQLCSDLAILAANAQPAVPAALIAARRAWRDRRAGAGGQSIVDTRYDAGHLLTGTSRRLVDVCGELDLDVTQPELARASMTALHRRWLATGNTEARERITVLNLRHSLSTGLVASRAAGHAAWATPLNVNTMIDTAFNGQIGWLDHPTFQALVNADGDH